MAIQFIVKRNDLVQALGFVRPTPLRARQSLKEVVEVYACKSEVEFVATSATSSLPAQVVSPGFARAPICVFEWFRKIGGTLPQHAIRISITDREVKAENLTYSHPNIYANSGQGNT